MFVLNNGQRQEPEEPVAKAHAYQGERHALEFAQAGGVREDYLLSVHTKLCAPSGKGPRDIDFFPPLLPLQQGWYHATRRLFIGVRLEFVTSGIILNGCTTYGRRLSEYVTIEIVFIERRGKTLGRENRRTRRVNLFFDWQRKSRWEIEI